MNRVLTFAGCIVSGIGLLATAPGLALMVLGDFIHSFRSENR